MSLINLPESFLYQRLPQGLIALDERALIQSLVGGYQDRLEDLRSYAKNFQLFFSPVGLPQAGPNVVFVDVLARSGKTFTRSLDITSATPIDPTQLLGWVAQQLNVDQGALSNARLGTDLLRLVDANILDGLAATIGAVLYKSAVAEAQPDVINATGTYSASQIAHQKLVQLYFPRLKFKGTQRSFEAMGKLMGFDDVRMTPLWGRVSPRLPNDPGSPVNDSDFSEVPEFYPQQELGPFYDPLNQADGAFYSWFGTVSSGTADNNFYTQVVNGFQPYVGVSVHGGYNGTITHPQDGTYALAGGAPHTKALVAAGSNLTFSALGEGDSWNGIDVVVSTCSGTLKRLDIADRMSSIKYRTSYYDLGITMDADKADTTFGTMVPRTNKDVAAAPHAYKSFNGTIFGTSPYRPFTGGSAVFQNPSGIQTVDFITPATGTLVSFQERHEASLSDAQQNFDDLAIAGQGVTQALEEVRAATRTPRRASYGYLQDDDVTYAPVKAREVFINLSTGSHYYQGTFASPPLVPYTTQVTFISPFQTAVLGAEIKPSDPRALYYKWTGSDAQDVGTISGYVVLAAPGTNFYAFTATGTFASSSQVRVDYFGTIGVNNKPDYFEVVRPEPVIPAAPKVPGPDWSAFVTTHQWQSDFTSNPSFPNFPTGGFTVGSTFSVADTCQPLASNTLDIASGTAVLNYTGAAGSVLVDFSSQVVASILAGDFFQMEVYQDGTQRFNTGQITQSLLQRHTLGFVYGAGSNSHFEVRLLDNINGFDFPGIFAAGTFSNAGTLPFVDTDPTKRYVERPEDQLDDDLRFETADEYPYRRDIIGSGEIIETDFVSFYGTEVPVYAILDQTMAVKDQTSAEYEAFVIDGHGTNGPRFVLEPRPIAPYSPAQRAICFSGTFRDQSSLGANDLQMAAKLGGRTSSSHSELDNVFQPGYQLYHAGLVNGVLVADPDKFNGAHHSKFIAGWLPFNEHPEDDLAVKDAVMTGASQTVQGVAPSDRRLDTVHGRYLRVVPSARISSSAARDCTDSFALSCWVKLPVSQLFQAAGEQVLAFGDINMRVFGDTGPGQNGVYFTAVTNSGTVNSTSYDLTDWTFVYLRKTPTTLTTGMGSLTTPVTETSLTNLSLLSNSGTDILFLTGASLPFHIRDLRIWNDAKSKASMEKVRSYSPVPTVVPYRVGHVLTLNRMDRYGLQVLQNGWLAPTQMPAWVRTPKYAAVVRYNGDGEYEGEPWRKEVGLGGGQLPPSPFQLGQQFFALSATGTLVAAPQLGEMPGSNAFWEHDTGTGSYIRLSGLGAQGSNAVVTSSGSGGNPWPNLMVATNPCRESIWLADDNGHVYQAGLQAAGTTGGATFVAVPGTRSYQEQGDAMCFLATPGTKLGVTGYGTVVQKTYAGTVTTPPLYMYLNSTLLENAGGSATFQRWTDPTPFGYHVGFPALKTAGQLNLTNNSTLKAGNYRLLLDVGNYGQPDLDFDGFRVNITAADTTFTTTLLPDANGNNLRGTQEVDFSLDHTVSGPWLLTIDWTNPISQPSRGTARQLVLFGYQLLRLETNLYQVSIAGAGTTPVLTKVVTTNVSNFGTVPGGWLLEYGSHGTIVQTAHEANVYPSNDTTTSRFPLANILTGLTGDRREDVISNGTFLLPDLPDPAVVLIPGPDWTKFTVFSGDSFFVRQGNFDGTFPPVATVSCGGAGLNLTGFLSFTGINGVFNAAIADATYSYAYTGPPCHCRLQYTCTTGVAGLQVLSFILGVNSTILGPVGTLGMGPSEVSVPGTTSTADVTFHLPGPCTMFFGLQATIQSVPSGSGLVTFSFLWSNIL